MVRDRQSDDIPFVHWERRLGRVALAGETPNAICFFLSVFLSPLAGACLFCNREPGVRYAHPRLFAIGPPALIKIGYFSQTGQAKWQA